jgi:hypothetical protein
MFLGCSLLVLSFSLLVFPPPPSGTPPSAKSCSIDVGTAVQVTPATQFRSDGMKETSSRAHQYPRAWRVRPLRVMRISSLSTTSANRAASSISCDRVRGWREPAPGNAGRPLHAPAGHAARSQDIERNISGIRTRHEQNTSERPATFWLASRYHLPICTFLIAAAAGGCPCLGRG